MNDNKSPETPRERAAREEGAHHLGTTYLLLRIIGMLVVVLTLVLLKRYGVL